MHTPGPWEIRVGAYDLFRDLSVWPEGSDGKGENRIACWIKTEENARLIAAAPDAFAVCQSLVYHYQDLGELLGRQGGEAEAILKAARAVIAKVIQ